MPHAIVCVFPTTLRCVGSRFECIPSSSSSSPLLSPPPHITSHRIASHRIASHHITSHHITSHHITHHTSSLTHHTSHIAHHTSHITHHTSHITHHTSHITSCARASANLVVHACTQAHTSQASHHVTSYRSTTHHIISHHITPYHAHVQTLLFTRRTARICADHASIPEIATYLRKIQTSYVKWLLFNPIHARSHEFATPITHSDLIRRET